MSTDALKLAGRRARARRYVEHGMKLGLGTGSTAAGSSISLGQKVRAGLEVVVRADLGGDAGAGRGARHSA